MEWMLQVVDEIDDAVAIVRQRWLGARIHLAALLAGALSPRARGVTSSTPGSRIRSAAH